MATLGLIAELSYRGDFQQAQDLLEPLLLNEPQNVMYRFCMVRLKNALGNWPESLEFFESVRGFGVFGGELLTQRIPLWDGIPLQGKRLIVALEGGLGNIICFSRFAKNLKDLDAQVILVTDPQMFPLLRSLLHDFKVLWFR